VVNTLSTGSTAQEAAGPTTAGPKRLTAAARRAQLVDVAIAMFGQRGYRGATTKAIAEAAGVSEATIFRHFPSKDDLYIAAFRQRTGVGTEQLVAYLRTLADGGRDEELLHALAVAILTGYQQDRDLHRMLLYAWLDQDEAANRRMWNQMRQSPLFEFLEGYIARRQAEGVFGPGDPALLCRMVVALPVSYGTPTKLYGIEPAAADEEVAALHARFLMAGLRGTDAASAS
jgi:TetR/AcrR family transcriptional regulator